MNLNQVILSILETRVGKDWRMSRVDLRLAASYELQRNVSDREMRQSIEELRRTHERGALICSTSGLSGYWMAQDYDELLQNYCEERRRALSLMYTMRQRLRVGRNAFAGQLKLI